MKKLLSFFVVMIVGVAAMSQKSEKQIIEDSVYGWYKVYNFKAKEYKPQVAYGRTFTPKQKAYVDSLANWIQASYIPKGGIGDVKRRVIAPHSEYVSLESLPQGYGVTAFTWSMEINKTTGKHDIIRETEIPFGIYANEVNGYSINALCTPTQYYFTRPGKADDRFQFTDPSLRSKYDITQLPQLKKYITFYSEASAYDRNANLVDAVLLSKDNKMPYTTVTKGEYLDLLPDAVERAYQKDVEYTQRQWSAGSARDEVMKIVLEKKQKRLERIRENRERYKNRLQEVATVFTSQPDILLENFTDIFEGNGGATEKYPVYKVDPVMAAKCKEDNPQWILITWNWQQEDPKLVHMHESIINNFNFDYVYDFFFNPDKVKGKPYKPLRDPYPIAVNSKATISAKAKKIKAEDGVFYYEDFSSSSLNQKPTDWYSEISIAGVHAKVINLTGLDGNWLQLKGNRVTALQLPKPLPANFIVSFDLAVPKGFTWGAKGLELFISQKNKDQKEEAGIYLKLRPGFDGRDGFTSLSAYAANNTTITQSDGAAFGFSNNLPINLVKVELQKNGEQVMVKVNGKPAGSLSKSLPASILLNSLSFNHSRSDAEAEKYFISNIRIDSK